MLARLIIPSILKNPIVQIAGIVLITLGVLVWNQNRVHDAAVEQTIQKVQHEDIKKAADIRDRVSTVAPRTAPARVQPANGDQRGYRD